MATPEAEKQCPFCKKWVPWSARRCRFCQETLGARDEREPLSPRRRPPPYAEEVDPPPARPDYRSGPTRLRPEEDYDDEPRPRRRRRVSRQGPYADCPRCGCPGFAEKVSFTWWGGVLGPSMLCHVRCSECGTCYNGRTGRDNTTGIVVYTVVGVLIALAFLVIVVLATHK